MNSYVLDASALLAFLLREQGRESVADAIATGSLMSTVNLSEVASKLADGGSTEGEIREMIGPLGLEFADFDVSGALSASLLRSATRAVGLSLGDRACIALGLQRNLPVLTADRAWSTLDLGEDVRIVLIR